MVGVNGGKMTMDLERAAIAAMQALLKKQNDDDYQIVAARAMEYALALKHEFDVYVTAQAEEGAYDQLKGRVDTDDKLWQAGEADSD
jgi:hypothetical protein